MVSFRCFDGSGGFGGFVSVFRVLVHAETRSSFFHNDPFSIALTISLVCMQLSMQLQSHAAVNK